MAQNPFLCQGSEANLIWKRGGQSHAGLCRRQDSLLNPVRRRTHGMYHVTCGKGSETDRGRSIALSPFWALRILTYPPWKPFHFKQHAADKRKWGDLFSTCSCNSMKPSVVSYTTIKLPCLPGSNTHWHDWCDQQDKLLEVVSLQKHFRSDFFSFGI